MARSRGVEREAAPFRTARDRVNIRANGEVDVAEEVLAQCDWVVASVHPAFDKNPTERLVADGAPRVDCIGHPTAASWTSARPTIDIELVIEKALETRTFLELNSSPTGSTCAT